MVDKGNVQTVPDSIKNSAAKIALYHNLNENEELVNLMHGKIMSTKKADFRANEYKIREVKNEIYEALKSFGINDYEEVERVYKIVEAQKADY
jgi:type I restriction enzyme R subunit